MNRIMKRFLAVCVCLALFASYGFSLAEDAPDSRIARKENVYETAKQIFAISWMPRDTEISVLDEGYGLWNIQAKDRTELCFSELIPEAILQSKFSTGTGIYFAK